MRRPFRWLLALPIILSFTVGCSPSQGTQQPPSTKPVGSAPKASVTSDAFVQVSASFAKLAGSRQESDSANNLLQQGWQHEHGLNGKIVDRISARQCYRKAAEMGSIEAEVAARLMEYLQQVPDSSPEAARQIVQNCFPKLVEIASNGSPMAQVLVGNCYFRECGVEQDLNESRAWFQKAADQNCPIGMAYMALMLQQTGEPHFTEAIDLLRRSSEKGYCGADFLLACAFESGQGVEINSAEMIRYTRRAADQGNEWAMVNLGLYYAKGKGVAQDHSQALEWFLKASLIGMPDALRFCGYYLTQTQSVPTERCDELLKSLEAVARDGRPNFAFELCMILLHLADGAKDDSSFDQCTVRAHRLLSLYARRSDNTAWYFLAKLFGMRGRRYPHNDMLPEFAYYCCWRASELGNSTARDELQRIDSAIATGRRWYIASVKADKKAYIREEEEGGFYAPTWASSPTVDPDRYKNIKLSDSDVLAAE